MKCLCIENYPSGVSGSNVRYQFKSGNRYEFLYNPTKKPYSYHVFTDDKRMGVAFTESAFNDKFSSPGIIKEKLDTLLKDARYKEVK